MREKIYLRPYETIEPQEWARYAKARRVTGKALAALLPAYIKRHMAARTMPAKFKPELAQRFPHIETGAQSRIKNGWSIATASQRGRMRYVGE